MKTNKFMGSRLLVLITVLMLGYSCAKSESKYDRTSEDIMLESTGETPVLASVEERATVDKEKLQTQKSTIDFKLKIIKNANCRIQVKNVEAAIILAKQIASRYDGYVSDERFTNTNYAKENRFTIRVPKGNFDIVLDSICKLAEFVAHKNISTIDVTEEYVDITARLKTKLEVKERYETILRTRAKTVEDILKAEDKLRKLQEEIESAQGRLNYLGNRVTFSTIQLDMYETVVPKELPPHYEPGFLDRAQKGLSFGWSMIENLTLILFYAWPFLILGIMIFIYFKWMRK